MKLTLLALLSAAVAVPAAAQIAPTAAIITPIAPAGQAMLRQGTAVSFKTEQALSSKTSRVGDRFELRSVEDVKIASQVVIPAGSRGVGEVTNVVKKGAFGKSGKLDTRVLYVTIGENRISMAGKSHDQGKGGTVGVVAAAVLLWPVMPFVTGKSAEFPIGTAMSGFVENDIPIALAAPAAPLVIPVAAPVVTATNPAVIQVSTPAQ